MKGIAMTRRSLPLLALMLTVASRALLCASSPVFAANQVGTNLNDSGAGGLRQAIADVGSGASGRWSAWGCCWRPSPSATSAVAAKLARWMLSLRPRLRVMVTRTKISTKCWLAAISKSGVSGGSMMYMSCLEEI